TAFFVNCYAPGFSKLRWNQNGILDKYPPETLAPLDSLLPLPKLLLFFQTDDLSFTDKMLSGEKDYVVIFWNYYILKQSKILMKTIEKNVALSDRPVEIIYVNNDRLFLEK